MMMPATAKETTAPSAAASINISLRCRTSAKRAPTAQTTPNALSHSGPRAEEARTDERSGRRRSCKSNAATPMAATTTKATGLRNATRLVENDQPQGGEEQPGGN